MVCVLEGWSPRETNGAGEGWGHYVVAVRATPLPPLSYPRQSSAQLTKSTSMEEMKLDCEKRESAHTEKHVHTRVLLNK